MTTADGTNLTRLLDGFEWDRSSSSNRFEDCETDGTDLNVE